MIYAVKSVPGLADVRVLHGDGDGPRTPPRCLEGVWKKFQMTNLTIPNNIFLHGVCGNQFLAVLMLGFPNPHVDRSDKECLHLMPFPKI